MSSTALLVTLLTSCTASRFTYPLTAREAASSHSEDALAAYLAQPNASASMCSLRGAGAHLTAYSAETQHALLSSIAEARVAPGAWRRCVETLLPELPEGVVVSFYRGLLAHHYSLLTGRSLERNPDVAASAFTIQRLYLDRRPSFVAPGTQGEGHLADLRLALDNRWLGRVAAGFARELLDVAALEHGTWQGRLVDEAMMDALADAGNELTLARFATRLPSSALRAAARLRLVRVRAALSPFREVRHGGSELEARVVELGNNPVSLAAHPPRRARWADGPALPVVRVRQDVWHSSGTLLTASAAAPGMSVLPDLPLRGALQVTLQGISREVTLCDAPHALDPSPCVDVAAITLGSDLASVGPGGAIRLAEHVGHETLTSLASQDGLRVPIRLAGTPVATLSLELKFELPPPIVIMNDDASKAPDLSVRAAWPAEGGRVRFDIAGEDLAYTVFVEQRDVPRLRIISRGRDGAPGMSGSDGMPGSTGHGCDNGGPGGPGANGSPGEDGADGGDILTDLACAAPDGCAEALALLRQVVRSEGGAGGPGGRGGSGGAGGSGGPGRIGTTTGMSSHATKSLSDVGCSPGQGGAQGPSGVNGSPGSPGRPGRIRIERTGADTRLEN